MSVRCGRYKLVLASCIPPHLSFCSGLTVAACCGRPVLDLRKLLIEYTNVDM